MESPDLWIKTLHILAVISWMAGMLYLPRLFVYHAGAQPKSETSELFKVMERRLFKGIMNPAMVVTVATGLWLDCREEYFLSPWMHLKLALAAGLLGLHVFFGLQVRAFAEDRNADPALLSRVITEAPTVLMILIVFLVMMKPFDRPPRG